ncbi:MAG: RNA polymerase sigma factor [Actinomycetota bacterium]|nr:RNA polymerase sigma factor [Actinomycetota bacterium]
MPPPSRERWEELYRQEFPHVYRALFVVLRDGEVAKDALHDAFAEGLRRPPAEDENLTGWLFRVALRFGRRGLRGTATELLNALSISNPKDETAMVLDRVEVGQLLSILSTRQRAMVIAQYYLDLEQEEIARLFGVQRGTVAATLAQARARMRAGGRDAS